MLIILISWLAIIFMSAVLFAPPNATVIVAVMLAALSVAGAIFLILELDMPFDSVIQISQAPMRNALIHLGHVQAGEERVMRFITLRQRPSLAPKLATCGF